MALRLFSLSFLVFVQVWSAELAVPFPVHEGDRIERVSMPKKEYFRPLEEEKFYLGELPQMVFDEFQKFRGRNGWIYLVDLSSGGKYFDALPYDTLELNASLKHFRLALADERLSKWEDNRIVAQDLKKITLSPDIKGLDLQRLKYVVILTREPLGSVELVFKKEDHAHRFTDPHRALWAWRADRVEPKRLKATGIGRIYLQIGPGFSPAAESIASEGIEIYALDGSPSDIDHFEALARKFSKLPLHSIKGIQLDVEPYLMKEYRLDPHEVLERYLKLLGQIKRWCHVHDLRFSVTVPFWFGTLKSRGEAIFPKILQEVDEVVLMSYRSDPKEVLRISADALRWGEWMQKRVDIGVELKPLDDEEHIIYQVEASNPCIAANIFHQKCWQLKQIRRYTLSGSSLSFYGNPKGLAALLRTPIPYSSFGGFVFHDESMLELLESAIK
jgi:hypothetical protein